VWASYVGDCAREVQVRQVVGTGMLGPSYKAFSIWACCRLDSCASTLPGSAAALATSQSTFTAQSSDQSNSSPYIGLRTGFWEHASETASWPAFMASGVPLPDFGRPADYERCMLRLPPLLTFSITLHSGLDVGSVLVCMQPFVSHCTANLTLALCWCACSSPSARIP
jgi:hypothetical protein